MGSVRRGWAEPGAVCCLPLCRLFIVLAVGAGLLALVALAGCQPQSPEGDVTPLPAASAVTRAALPDEAKESFERAAAALRAQDHAAWRAALPASGTVARRAVDGLYDKLAPLPWSAFAFRLDEIPGEPGRFDVRATGALAGVGPADRIVAERVLDLKVRSGCLVVTADQTPKAVMRQYLMAFGHPITVRRPGCVVIADGSWRPKAKTVADACAPARERIAAAGIKPGRPVAVYLYSSIGQLRASLGGGPAEKRIRFFSRGTDRGGPASAAWLDIGVLAPALAGQDAWIPTLLTHELTHAYTVRWFADTEHAPLLLVEGLAVMAEGSRGYAALRAELAAASPTLPLTTAVALGSLWMGNSAAKVHLLYLEGGSLMAYVVNEWGLIQLRRFVIAVADSDLSRSGLDKAARRSLGRRWAEVEAGWRGYVFSLP